MMHSESIFCRLHVDFLPPNFCVIFVFKALISNIRDAGEFLPLAVTMREGISPSCSRGSRVSPGKILEKWTQTVHSEPILSDCKVSFTPYLCNFGLQSSDLRYT